MLQCKLLTVLDCAVPSDKLINALASEVISAELNPLGVFMDRLETRRLRAQPEDRADKFLAVAQRARKLIESGVDLPQVRKECMKSPTLFALLEAVLFERAAARGRLETGINWSGYGRCK